MKKHPAGSRLTPYLGGALMHGSPPFRGTRLLRSIQEEMAKKIESPRRILEQSPSDLSAGGLLLRTIYYSLKAKPSWAPDRTYTDTVHHLVVIAVKDDYALICGTEPTVRNSFVREAACATLVPRAIIEQAFVGAQARVLWLDGWHVPTASKASSKTLMGPDLALSLDPLGDQTYCYSAVRSHIKLNPAASIQHLVGASPSSARIWVNRSKSWRAFTSDADLILNHLASPPVASAQFPALAQTEIDLSAAKNAFDVAIVPTELLTNDDMDPADREVAMRWAYDSAFTVKSQIAQSITADVTFEGADLGEVAIEFRTVGEVVIPKLTWKNVTASVQQQNALTSLVESDGYLKAYFGSGHTIAQGRCYKAAYRDQPFPWRFIPLQRFDVTKEKPDIFPGRSLAESIGEIKADGSMDDSLFGCCVRQLFKSGWLASDDGSMELADFVHIEKDVVTLLHAKAAGSAKPNREVSASKYEVVVGQAVKNIRHLDRTNLMARLTGGSNKAIASAVWHNGKRKADRDGILKAALSLPPNYQKRVIVFQPQLTEKEHEKCKKGAAPVLRLLRMNQLNTLMLAARLSINAVGAEFLGYGAK